MFTTNQVCAAPVKVSAERARRGYARAIVVNSGNANACTGKQGLKDAQEMTHITAKAIGSSPDEVLVCSTGRIGLPLPMANVKKGILAAAPLLNAAIENAGMVAEAIMTSDTRVKQIAIELKLDKVPVRLGGVCKGAGMIQPGMSRNGARPPAGLHATMLSFITTDAAIEPRLLKQALEQAVAQSFNRITVDGDMSTNDTVLVLANGFARNKIISSASQSSYQKFQGALNFITLELAKKIVRDGEGVTRFITLHIYGARTAPDAESAARSIANSSLVKTSWFGGDPNWGRILCALGYSAARVDETKVTIGYSLPGQSRMLFALRKGQPTKTPFETLVKLVAEKEFELHVFLDSGHFDAVIYTGDLTEEYVEFNKGDVSDPKSLGG